MPSSPTFRIWSGGQKVRHNRALSAELQFSVKNYGRMNIVPGVVPLFVMSWEWIPIIPSPLKPLDDSAVTSSPSTCTCTMSPPFTTPLFGPTSENLGGSSSQLSGDSTDFDVLVKYLLGDDDTVPITGDTDLIPLSNSLQDFEGKAVTKNIEPAPIATSQPFVAKQMCPSSTVVGKPTSTRKQSSEVLYAEVDAKLPSNPASKRRRKESPVMASSGTQYPNLDNLAQAFVTNTSDSPPNQKQSSDSKISAGIAAAIAYAEKRKENNRILAHRIRLRKKFFLESLQKEVLDLQRENTTLKNVVKTHLGHKGQALLQTCNARKQLPQVVLDACAEHCDGRDYKLVKGIQQSQHAFVITDPSLPDNPVVFASEEFLKVTEYTRDGVLGRNCRFLQGTKTSPEKIAQIRKGLAHGDDVSVTLLNYTSKGTPFWNRLFIASLRDIENNVVNHIGVLVKVSKPPMGDPER